MAPARLPPSPFGSSKPSRFPRKEEPVKPILCLLLAALLLGGCQSSAPAATTEIAQTQQTTAPSETSTPPETTDGALYENLTAWASSQEEARSIAESYGIQLCSYAANIATFHTDDDPHQVVRRGREQGLPELSVNGQAELFQ